MEQGFELNKKQPLPREERVEKLYFHMSIGFLLLAPFFFYFLVQREITFQFNAFVFLAAVLGIMPLTFVLEYLCGRVRGDPPGFRPFAHSPSVQHTFPVKKDAQECVQTILDRLKPLGFAVHLIESARRIEFSKPKSTGGYAGFLDHALSGYVRLQPVENGTELWTAVMFGDTIVIDTGEKRHVTELVEYLALQREKVRFLNLPLPLLCGMNLAFASLIADIFVWCAVPGAVPSAFALAAASAAMILLSFLTMIANRKHLIGFRLGFLGLCLAAIPYVALVLGDQ